MSITTFPSAAPRSTHLPVDLGLFRVSRPTYPAEHLEDSKINGRDGVERGLRRGVNRDPFVDTLRVLAVVLVVAQHWLMPVVGTDAAGDLVTGNALAQPGAWVVTWVSQVMPLVFFAGGASTRYSTTGYLRRGDAAAARRWVARRVFRLAAPVLPLAAVWVPLPHLLVATGVPADTVAIGSRLIGGLLWFLASYTVIVAITPLLLRWHDRSRGWEIATLAAAAVAVDLIRFASGSDVWGYANVAFVWCAVYLIGVAYAEGRLDALIGRKGWLVAAIGFGVTAVGVVAGPYAASMIGMPGAPLSNMNPPTAVLLALSAGQLGVALTLRPRIVAWAQIPEVARTLGALSRRLMTIYVWHTPALVAVTGVAVLGFGWSTPTPFGAQWRYSMPFWLAALTIVLVAAVSVFGRFELSRSAPAATPARSVVGIAVLLVAAGLLILTLGGFVPSPDGLMTLSAPVVASLAIAVGSALLRIRRITGSNTAPANERLSS